MDHLTYWISMDQQQMKMFWTPLLPLKKKKLVENVQLFINCTFDFMQEIANQDESDQCFLN